VGQLQRDQRRGDDACRERVNRGQPDHAFQSHITPGDGPLGRQSLYLNPLGIAQHALAQRGERKATRQALKQPRAGAVLHRREPAAHRWLRHLKRPRRAGQRAVPGNGEKGAEIIPIHDALYENAWLLVNGRQFHAVRFGSISAPSTQLEYRQ
jgi:hypothetical protein